MKTFPERLRHAIEISEGKTQAQLARFCGISSAAVAGWLKTGKISDANMSKAAEFLGVSPIWLSTGEGDIHAKIKTFAPGATIPEGYVSIPEFRLRFTCGPDGYEPEWEEVEDASETWYRESFFTSRGVKPERCRRCKARGGSMEPVINDGDTFLFEEFPEKRAGSVTILDGRLYAISIDGDLRLKYVSKIKNGLLIESANPRFRPEEYVGEECDRIMILGRVLEVTHTF